VEMTGVEPVSATTAIQPSTYLDNIEI